MQDDFLAPPPGAVFMIVVGISLFVFRKPLGEFGMALMGQSGKDPALFVWGYTIMSAIALLFGLVSLVAY